MIHHLLAKHRYSSIQPNFGWMDNLKIPSMDIHGLSRINPKSARDHSVSWRN